MRSKNKIFLPFPVVKICEHSVHYLPVCLNVPFHCETSKHHVCASLDVSSIFSLADYFSVISFYLSLNALSCSSHLYIVSL